MSLHIDGTKTSCALCDEEQTPDNAVTNTDGVWHFEDAEECGARIDAKKQATEARAVSA